MLEDVDVDGKRREIARRRSFWVARLSGGGSCRFCMHVQVLAKMRFLQASYATVRPWVGHELIGDERHVWLPEPQIGQIPRHGSQTSTTLTSKIFCCS